MICQFSSHYFRSTLPHKGAGCDGHPEQRMISNKGPSVGQAFQPVILALGQRLTGWKACPTSEAIITGEFS
jgi:hypothetical protein